MFEHHQTAEVDTLRLYNCKHLNKHLSVNKCTAPQRGHHWLTLPTIPAMGNDAFLTLNPKGLWVCATQRMEAITYTHLYLQGLTVVSGM